ncbi:hypothetical protein Forpe1208_v009784 [Fusarium oxysporum f. sp. rapae]|uniref:Uncharacterized protein n=1 Tax=Fusarium oxysporum f. sp. rapae TaxID=485398 RepID=A0A8J5U5W1_FUSOX|nr:hypothetical protein Forpe1208_v009784 [Fusarium oxysporum f. sp. rapae]
MKIMVQLTTRGTSDDDPDKHAKSKHSHTVSPTVSYTIDKVGFALIIHEDMKLQEASCFHFGLRLRGTLYV